MWILFYSLDLFLSTEHYHWFFIYHPDVQWVVFLFRNLCSAKKANDFGVGHGVTREPMTGW